MAHNIMQNDNVILVNDPAWHGLGEVFDSPPSIEETWEKAFPWKVRMLDIQAIVPRPEKIEGIFRPRINIPAFKAIQRVDTGEIFKVLTDKYSPLQNDEMLQVIAPLVESGDIQIETAGSLENGRKVWALAKIKADPTEIRKDDPLLQYVLISSSHDGSNAVRLGFCPIRVVCNNTLSMAHDSGASQLIKVYHKGDVKRSLDELRNIMNVQTRSFLATVDQYKALDTINISETDMIKYIRMIYPPPVLSEEEKAKKNALTLENVLEASEEIVDLNEVIDISEEVIDMDALSKREESILNVLNAGRGAANRQKEITLWDAYNAVNEFLLYEKGNDSEKRLSSAWFGQSKSQDEKALEHAIELYQMKTA